MNDNKRYRLIFSFLIACFSLSGFGQQSYPIYVMPSLTPPHSLTLSDYANPGSQQLVVTIMVNDVSITELPVRLHLKIETMTGITIESLPNITTTPIYMSGGQVSVLFGDDLADYFNINNLRFQGYSKEEYRRTGQLPEGFYRFTVEVRHFTTGRLISNQGTTMTWIALGKPPLLKTPDDTAELGQITGMPLTFSWIPNAVGIPSGGIQYTFELWEMRIPGIDPYVVAASMPVFYSTTQMNTTLVVHPAELFLEPGMRYAWRVTASDLSGQVPFADGGHSLIRTFTYQCKCEGVTNFTVEPQSKGGIFRWTPASNHTSFNIEMENPTTGWSKKDPIFDNQLAFSNLEEGKTYRMRVQAICDGNAQNPSDFSSWQSLSIPERKPIEETCPDCGCEDAAPEPAVTNFTLRKDLKPGDIIHSPSGNSRYILKTVNQQSDGVYKGQFFFWLEVWNIKVLCDYWDLSVNTDDEIVGMGFESVYDPKFLLDVDAAQDYLNNLADAVAELTKNTAIKDSIAIDNPIEEIYTNEQGQVVVVTKDANGNPKEQVISDTDRTLITDPEGNRYVADKDGNVMGEKEFKETGGNSRLIDNYNKEKESKADPKIHFSKSEKQAFGFDAYNDSKSAFLSEYPELKSGYRPPFKSLQSFQTDIVETDAGSGIIFRTEMGIPVTADGKTLTLRGTSNGDEQALYAYTLKDSTETVVGKLDLLSFQEQFKTVHLVSVNGASRPDKQSLQDALNKIYAPAVTTWTVKIVEKSVNVTFANGKMTHGGSGALAIYNADQKKIIKTFGTENKDDLYLFFVKDVQGKEGVNGYMPQQYQNGFIYDTQDAKTVAHELAHGAFNLAHTLGADANLMSSSLTGTELWKHQWKLVQNPKNLFLKFLQDEEDAEIKQSDSGNEYLIEAYKRLNQIGEMINENKFVILYTANCFTPAPDTEEHISTVSLYNPELNAITGKKEEPVNAKAVTYFYKGRINIAISVETANSVFFASEGIEVSKISDDEKRIVELNSGTFFGLLTRDSVYQCDPPKEDVCNVDATDTERMNLFYASMMTRILNCIQNDEQVARSNRVGDSFFYMAVTRYPNANRETLKDIADKYDKMADILFKGQANGNEWSKYGEFFEAGFEAAQKAENIDNGDYLNRLNEFIKIFEKKLSQLNDIESDKIALFVGAFSDRELRYLPMKLRINTLSILAQSPELKNLLDPMKRDATTINWAMRENMILKLLKQIEPGEEKELLEKLRHSYVIRAINNNLDDFITLTDDHYTDFLDIIDEYVYSVNHINENTWGEWLQKLYDEDKTFNISEIAQKGERFISATGFTDNAEIKLQLSEFSGQYNHDIQYDGYDIVTPVYEQSNRTLAYDQPVAIYHNKYLSGVSSDNLGSMQIASALRAHYYLQKHKDEVTATAIWTTIDVATLVVGVGEISAAVKAAKGWRLVLGVCNTASSAGSLLATGLDKYLIDEYGKEGEEFIQSLRKVSAVLGFADLGASGVRKFKNMLDDDLVTIGKFHKNHGAALKADAQTTKLEEATQKLVDDFDDEIMALINNAGADDLIGIKLPRYPSENFLNYVNSAFTQQEKQYFEIAKSYYIKNTTNFNINHLRGIDFSQEVVIAKKTTNTKMYQVSKLDADGNVIYGSYYFDNINENVTKLGIGDMDKIIEDKKVLIEVTINKETEFLKSKTINIEDWNNTGIVFEGGATQYFNPNAQSTDIDKALTKIIRKYE